MSPLGVYAPARAFYSFITIPDSVTCIGYAAFFSTSLTSVTFKGKIANLYDGFSGDLRDKYLAGGIGTYTREANRSTWTKQ